MRENTVWVAPDATGFSCLCEPCLEAARGDGSPFLDAVRVANLRGTLELEAAIGFVRCASGHQLIVRRIDRPPTLARRDTRQLQLV